MSGFVVFAIIIAIIITIGLIIAIRDYQKKKEEAEICFKLSPLIADLIFLGFKE